MTKNNLYERDYIEGVRNISLERIVSCCSSWYAPIQRKVCLEVSAISLEVGVFTCVKQIVVLMAVSVFTLERIRLARIWPKIFILPLERSRARRDIRKRHICM